MCFHDKNCYIYLKNTLLDEIHPFCELLTNKIENLHLKKNIKAQKFRTPKMLFGFLLQLQFTKCETNEKVTNSIFFDCDEKNIAATGFKDETKTVPFPFTVDSNTVPTVKEVEYRLLGLPRNLQDSVKKLKETNWKPDNGKCLAVLEFEFEKLLSEDQLKKLKENDVVVWNFIDTQGNRKRTFFDIKKSKIALADLLQMFVEANGELSTFKKTNELSADKKINMFPFLLTRRFDANEHKELYETLKKEATLKHDKVIQQFETDLPKPAEKKEETKSDKKDERKKNSAKSMCGVMVTGGLITLMAMSFSI